MHHHLPRATAKRGRDLSRQQRGRRPGNEHFHALGVGAGDGRTAPSRDHLDLVEAPHYRLGIAEPRKAPVVLVNHRSQMTGIETGKPFVLEQQVRQTLTASMPGLCPSASASAAPIGDGQVVPLGRHLGTAVRAPFGGPRQESGAEADGPCSPQVVVVRGDHEDSLRGQVQPRRRRRGRPRAAACRCARARPTGCGRSRARCSSPDHRAARHCRSTAAQTVNRLRSRASPMRTSGHAGSRCQAVDEPAAVVPASNPRPRSASRRSRISPCRTSMGSHGRPAAAHLLHRRLVPAAPSVGEPGPVRALTGPPVQLAAGVEHAAAPVDQRAEHVEGERIDRLRSQRVAYVVALRHAAAS